MCDSNTSRYYSRTIIRKIFSSTLPRTNAFHGAWKEAISHNPIIRIEQRQRHGGCRLRINQASCASNFTPVRLSIKLLASVFPRGFSAARRARELISLAARGISFSTAVYISPRYRIARVSFIRLDFMKRGPLGYGECVHGHARTCSRELTIFRRPICSDCLDRSQVAQVRLLSSWFLPSRSPGTPPLVLSFSPSPSSFLFLLEYNSHQPHPSLLRCLSSPPILSALSPPQCPPALFVFPHFFSVYFFRLQAWHTWPPRVQPPLQRRMNAWTGRRTGHKGRRDEREVARRGR